MVDPSSSSGLTTTGISVAAMKAGQPAVVVPAGGAAAKERASLAIFS